MTVYVDYEMVSKLAKDVRKSQEIKDRLFKEFYSWYFGSYLESSNELPKEKRNHWFVKLNDELDNDFEAVINQFLKDNYKDKE
tara:strand:- start:6260 stop:6508 length:249 start_codon:yes stop_codon:yes gene_type:complete